MATVTAASLADGQVANSKGTIYTAAGSVIVRSWTLYNSNAISQTANVYVKRSGSTSRQLYRFTLAQYASATVLASGELLTLSTGDVLEADTTTASAVDFYIGGATIA